MILHLFAGNRESARRWDDLQAGDVEVISLDILSGQNLHNPKLWSYLWWLSTTGRIRAVIGGPPCRTTSRLRHRRPGPRPLRGRDHLRFQLPGLTREEQDLVHGDTALIVKMLALYEVSAENAPKGRKVAFLMEHPSDVMDYMDGGEAEEIPSIWNWPEIEDFEEKHDLVRVKFDQGATGHVQRKPTTLSTNLDGMEELHGLQAKAGHGERLRRDLGERLQQTAAWSTWSMGLVAAVKATLSSLIKDGDGPMSYGCRKLTMEEWRQHVRQNHVPYRRDCRLCVEEMGQSLPHRRRVSQGGGEVAYSLSVDVVGPFKQGWDYGRGREAKYAILATIPVPLSEVDPEEEKRKEAKVLWRILRRVRNLRSKDWRFLKKVRSRRRRIRKRQGRSRRPPRCLFRYRT